MPTPSTASKNSTDAEKAHPKMAERKRVLKKGSDGDVIRAFANKKGTRS